MEFNLIDLVMYLLIWGIKLVRYMTLHVAISYVVDYIVFNPIMNWVEDHVIGAGPVVADYNATGDVNSV